MSDTVGVVNSEVITLADFSHRLDAIIGVSDTAPIAPKVSSEQYTQFVDSTWELFLTDVVVEHEIARRKIELSDHAVDSLLIYDPPEEIRPNLPDSLRPMYIEYLKKFLADPQNASRVSIMRNSLRIKFETRKLIASVSHESDEGPHPKFDAWLKKQKSHLKIRDYRTAFGYY